MIESVTAALSILCGLNTAQCQIASTVKLEQVATAPGVRGAQASYDPAKRIVYLSGDQPDVLVAQMAHELTHVQQIDGGESYTAQTCYGMELEAFRAEASAWSVVHDHDPAFTSPDGWAAVNAADDCRKATGR